MTGSTHLGILVSHYKNLAVLPSVPELLAALCGVWQEVQTTVPLYNISWQHPFCHLSTGRDVNRMHSGIILTGFRAEFFGMTLNTQRELIGHPR